MRARRRVCTAASGSAEGRGADPPALRPTSTIKPVPLRPPASTRIQRSARRPDLEITTSGGPEGTRVSGAVAGTEVGSLRLQRGRGVTGEVSDLEVGPSYRGLGYGAEMLASAAQLARHAGATRLGLSSADAGSGRLDSWYEGVGFGRSGEDLRGYTTFAAPTSKLEAAVESRSVGSRIQRMEQDEPPKPKEKSPVEQAYTHLAVISEQLDELTGEDEIAVVEWITSSSCTVPAWVASVKENLKPYGDGPSVGNFVGELTAASDEDLAAMVPVLEKLRAIVAQSRGGGGATTGGGLAGWQEALLEANVAASTALAKLSTASGRKPCDRLPEGRPSRKKAPTGVAQIKKLVAAYVSTYGLTAEWEFGKEWEDSRFGHIAFGFVQLLADLATAAMTDEATTRWLVETNFIDILLSWDKTFCHNIVVGQLQQALK